MFGNELIRSEVKERKQWLGLCRWLADQSACWKYQELSELQASHPSRFFDTCAKAPSYLER